MVAGGVIAFVQLRAPTGAPYPGIVRRYDPHAFALALGNAFFPMVPLVLSFPLALTVMLVLTLAMKRTPEAQLFMWGSISALGAIFIFIWMGSFWHYGQLFLVVIAAVWMADSRKRVESIDAPPSLLQIRQVAALALNVSLIVSAGAGLWWSLNDIRYGFSASREMAAYIRTHELERYEIAAHNGTATSAILPYLPGKKFWYAGLQNYGTYMKWDIPYERMLRTPYPVAEQIAKQHFDGRSYLLLFNVEMPNPEQHGFRSLYATRTKLFTNTDERFWLYASGGTSAPIVRTDVRRRR